MIGRWVTIHGRHVWIDGDGRMRTWPGGASFGNRPSQPLVAAKNRKTELAQRIQHRRDRIAKQRLDEAETRAKASGAKTRVLATAEEAKTYYGKDAPYILASYRAGNDTIVLNPFNGHWGDNKPDVVPGWFSTSRLDHVIEHELAHRDYALKVGFAEWHRVAIMGPPDPEIGDLIDREVGHYAATETAEFLAEAQVGLANGKSYSKPIMDLYRQLKGIMPAARKAG